MPSSLAPSLETGTVTHRAKHGLAATRRTAKTAIPNRVFIAGLLFWVARSELRHRRFFVGSSASATCCQGLLHLLGDDVLVPLLELGRGEGGGLALSREEIGREADDPVLADDLADLVPAGDLLVGQARRKGFCRILPLEDPLDLELDQDFRSISGDL